jgi:hypothetical protein
MKKVIWGLMIVGMFSLVACEDVSRMGKSIKSSVTGIEREVVWTGFDGSRKEWTGKFKIDSNKNSPTVYFINDDGKTVILGPGFYSIEK